MIRRCGFSLTEVLVSLGIISVLIALTVPAVQIARASADKVTCSHRMRQLGVAFHNYESAYSALPSLLWFRQLRPFMEIPDDHPAPAAFACPSDSHANGSVKDGRMSYAINDGLGDTTGEYGGVLSRHQVKNLQSRDIADGLSTTAAFGERLSFPSFAPQQVDWHTPPHYWNRTFRMLRESPASPKEFLTACDATTMGPMSSWFFVENYHHLLPPNRNSCIVIDRSQATRIPYGVTMGSLHSGGAFLTMCDGSTRFVSDFTDTVVWQALGTRSGGEVME